MISAAELRKIQEEYRLNDDKNRFINASDKYYNILLDECKYAIEYIQNNNICSIILKTDNLIRQIDAYSYTTMLYGFWNKETHSFNNNVFREYGILSPLERVTKDLEIFGYRLEHINDSKQLILKLSC